MAYNFLGAHPFEDDRGNKGYMFRVWAPKARSVSVMGDFNDWDAQANQMFKLGDTGIWEQIVWGAQQWDRYKYRNRMRHSQARTACSHISRNPRL